jgi:hypothetical protein
MTFVLPHSIEKEKHPEFLRMYQEMIQHPDLIEPFYDYVEISLKMANSIRTYDKEYKRLTDMENAVRDAIENDSEVQELKNKIDAVLLKFRSPIEAAAANFNNWAVDYHANISQTQSNIASKLMDLREEYNGNYTLPGTV